MTAWIAQVLTSLAVIASLPADTGFVTHLLERTSFGVRPGDVERVQAMGLDRYLDEQLHPERLSDTGVDARLAGLTTIGLSSRRIAEEFEMPAIQARKAAKAAGSDGRPNPEQQRKAATVIQELQQQKTIRAIYSNRQLQEVLVDFWFNHFNVDARKGADRFLLTSYERDVIRPRVLGKFRDLLGATAKSPAMLFYLDNWRSADPNGPHLDTTRRANPRRAFPPPQRP